MFESIKAKLIPEAKLWWKMASMWYFIAIGVVQALFASGLLTTMWQELGSMFPEQGWLNGGNGGKAVSLVSLGLALMGMYYRLKTQIGLTLEAEKLRVEKEFADKEAAALAVRKANERP